MKPRQSGKLYPTSNVPTYQDLPTSSLPAPTREDLAKLGIKIDDNVAHNVAATANSSPSQEEIAEFIQNLQSNVHNSYKMTNKDRPVDYSAFQMQPWLMNLTDRSPPPPPPPHSHGHLGRKGRGGMRRTPAIIDPYSTTSSGGPVGHGALNGVCPINTMNTGNNSSISNLSNIMNVGGLGSGLGSGNSNTVSGHHKQNIQFTTNSNSNISGNVNSTGACTAGGVNVGGGLSASNSSASHHAHQTASAINHFRVSNTNIHSPQQQLSQQKSVLSLHQQHQNDLSNSRRLNHHLSATNASFVNLQAAVNAPNATSTSTSSSSDGNVDLSNALSNNIVTTKNHCASSNLSTPSVIPNIMDTLSTMDPLFNDVSQINNPDTSTHYQQSMIKHHQLQKLLKAKSSHLKLSPSSVPSTTLTQRSDSQQVNSGKTPNSAQQQQLLPPPARSPANTISPPQSGFSAVPKSLLNLAACSPSSLGRPTTSTSTITTSGSGCSRSNQKQLAKSLLLDDQSCVTNRAGSSNGTNINAAFNNLKSTCNFNNPNFVNPKLTQQNQASNLSKRSNSSFGTREPNFLSNLQGRSSNTGISLSEIINKQDANPNQQFNNVAISQSNNLATQNQPRDDCSEGFDRREIESALSRVEARNDLSLLYPPMILAPNSQKQINALSAGLQVADDSELFTKEVKRIVLEECNIIYECKGCNNLFRSLANLVKHKRTYCHEQGSDRSNMELNKRLCTNIGTSIDQNNSIQAEPTTTLRSSPRESMQTIETHDTSGSPLLLGKNEQSSLLASYTSSSNQPIDWRFNNQEDSRLRRLMKTRAFNHQAREMISNDQQSKTRGSTNGNNPSSSRMQTSLCRLLQSQPKSLLPPPSRDSALAGALNMAAHKNDLLSGSPSSVLEGERDATNYSTSGINEHLVRNSSLAKTLLSEKAKVNSNSRHSLIELSKAELASNLSNSRTGPKRKFLEDCIRKVRRDKLLTEDESHLQVSTRNLSSESNAAANYNPSNPGQIDKSSTLSQHSNSDLSKLNSPSESELDSDNLMIDLDGSQKGDSPVKKARRQESDTEPSTSSSCKFRSSVLLKALTRPVHAKARSKVADTGSGSLKESLLSDSKPSFSPQDISKEMETNPPLADERNKKSNPRDASDTDNETALGLAESASMSEANDNEQNDDVNEDGPDFESQEASQSRSSSPVMSDDGDSDRDDPEEASSSSEKSSTSKHEESSVDHSNTPLQEPRDPTELSIPSPLFDKYTCDVCDTDFQHNWQLLTHTIRRHRDEAMIYPCIFCSLSFLTLENVCRHIVDTHKKPRAQVDRLKDVVKSRSYLKSDLEGCQDFPSHYETHSDRSESLADKESEGSKDEQVMDDVTMLNDEIMKGEDDMEEEEADVELEDEELSQEPCTSVGHPPNDNREEPTLEGEESRLSDSSSTSSNTAQKMSSSRSSGGSGGIMKLKIQLKTRPDDKNKVYEIV